MKGEKLFRKISWISVILIFSCAHLPNNGKMSPKNAEGIIFIEDEAKVNAKKKTLSIREADQSQVDGDSSDYINPAELEGIIFLNSDEQVYELSGLPLSLRPVTQRGKASYYADSFAGKITASGEIYDPKKFTAAHRTLPFGTKVRVTNLFNDKEVIVRINDRGPFIKSRIIDLSRAAAEKIGMIDYGVAEVIIKVVR